MSEQPNFPALSRDEITRYSRHILLPEIGMLGQQKLKKASVLIVGLGGLGSPIAMYLAAAGVGRIGLVDPDVVDLSNLQRQVIHATSSRGALKVESARHRMFEINPDIQIDMFPVPLTSTNALDVCAEYDILVDGTDNIPSRYLLSDLAVLTHRPYVYGSIYRFEGQVSVFGLQNQPCYRCLFPEPPPPGMVPPCSQAGVMGILPGTIGTIQATEVIKLITGIGQPLAGKLLLYDALQMTFDVVTIRKKESCPACGNSGRITDLIDYETWCGTGAETDLTSAGQGLDIEPQDLQDMLASGADVVLVDIREPFEASLADIPGSLKILPTDLEKKISPYKQQNQMIVLFCRNGTHTAPIVKKLSAGGMNNIRNLHGGINAWIDKVDALQTKY